MLYAHDAAMSSCEVIEAAWVAEAVRPAEELRRGEVEALDGESVLEALKAKLASSAW